MIRLHSCCDVWPAYGYPFHPRGGVHVPESFGQDLPRQAVREPSWQVRVVRQTQAWQALQVRASLWDLPLRRHGTSRFIQHESFLLFQLPNNDYNDRTVSVVDNTVAVVVAAVVIFCAHLIMLERAIAKVHLSIHPSVCQSVCLDPRLHGSSSRRRISTFRIIRYSYVA